MKKILLIFLIIGASFLSAQNMEATGCGVAAVNGTYVPSISSTPQTNDGVFYYTKMGTPTLFLYRQYGYSWTISNTLGSVSNRHRYYSKFMSNAPPTPDGLLLNVPSDLGAGFPPGPSINASINAPEIKVFINGTEIVNRSGYNIGRRICYFFYLVV